MADQPHHAIVPREKLDFDLDGDIPKYWWNADPFKTRFADALSTLFPEGERYFITSVRAYRDEVTDPQLMAGIKDFMRQEGQHGIIHDKYNQRLRLQGIDVDKIEGVNKRLIAFAEKHNSRAMNLAITASAEHLTALMAQSFFERKEVFENADPRMRALYAWHAMEEVEHKAVAFDVMKQVANVGYLMRVGALVQSTILNIVQTFAIMAYMLKVDGFSFRQRAGMWARGLWWLYGRGGLFVPTIRPYFTYFKPGFHPWHNQEGPAYETWLTVFNRSADPIAAANAVQARAR